MLGTGDKKVNKTKAIPQENTWNIRENVLLQKHSKQA